jgi:phosphoglycerate kinase
LLQTITEIDDLQFYGRRVFVRVDFNVSLKNGTVGEDYRIRMSIPTIDYLVKRGAKVILASHLDRPKFYDESKSLKLVAQRLGEMLGNAKVSFVNDCIGKSVVDKIEKLNYGDILLLENLRFHPGEEQNDPTFCCQLSELADIYVNDAFSTSHRKHASTYGIVKDFDIKLAGLNFKKELEYLSMIRFNPQKPFTLIVGGSKIKDKIGALENLIPRADKLLVGGAVAYTFLKARGYSTGTSLIDNEHLPWVTDALSDYGDKIMLPVDHLISKSPEEDSFSLVKDNIPEGFCGYDIGIQTAQAYSKEIAGKGTGTVFWNGPMGMFEQFRYANGTVNVAKSIALAYWRGSTTLVGGGDTLEAMKFGGVSESEVSHVSTGGGATLRFLAGDEMPGIEAIERQ